MAEKKKSLRVQEDRPLEYFAKPVFSGTKGDASGDFDIRNFCKAFHLVRPDLTRMTGYSLRSVDKWASGEKMGATPKRRFVEIRRIFDALAEIMEKDAVGEWVKTPNPAFEGSTPLQVIERGESDRLWRMVYLVGTGEPV